VDPERRLRVAVDAGPLLGERTGIGHVTARLLEGLAIRDDVEVRGYAIRRTAARDLADVLPPRVAPAASWLPARIVQPRWAPRGRPPREPRTGPSRHRRARR
jgi:hypothetical protein